MSENPAPVAAAFIGAGFMGQVHTRAARAAGARLAGIVGSTATAGAEAASALGVERGYADLDEVLADPQIDVVHVLTPNALHAPQAAAVLRAGKHVVCEKPLATDVTAARALVAEAEAAGVVAAVPFVYRFHPMVREARHRLRDQAPLTVEGRYLQDWMSGSVDNWRVSAKDGGASRAFGDIGSHLVDMVEFVTGRRITRLVARTLIAQPTRGGVPVETEDAVSVLAELTGGALVTLLVSQVAAGHKNHLTFQVSTADETVAFDQERPDGLWLGRVDGSLDLARDPVRLSPDAARLSVVPAGHPMGYPDAFAGLVGDVYAAVRGEVPDGLPTFSDGLRAVQITEAVLRSAATQQWVDVPEPDVSASVPTLRPAPVASPEENR